MSDSDSEPINNTSCNKKRCGGNTQYANKKKKLNSGIMTRGMRNDNKSLRINKKVIINSNNTSNRKISAGKHNKINDSDSEQNEDEIKIDGSISDESKQSEASEASEASETSETSEASEDDNDLLGNIKRFEANTGKLHLTDDYILNLNTSDVNKLWLLKQYCLLCNYDDSMIEYDNLKNKIMTWIHNFENNLLSDEEKCEVTELNNDIVNRLISEYDIINNSTSKEEQIYLMEQFNLLKEYYPNSEEYLTIKRNLHSIINSNKALNAYEKTILSSLENSIPTHTNMLQNIIHSNQSNNIKKIIFNKFKQMRYSTDDDSEKLKQWIKYSLQIPTMCKNVFGSDILASLNSIKVNLDKELYGMEKPKQRILEILASMYSNKDGNKKLLAFVGEPGVGKTALCRALSISLDIPFEQISLGGLKDSHTLIGHDYTYVGSKPGLIAESLCKIGILNGILFLDEFDKLCNSDHNGKEVVSTLLHVLDYSQNHEFRDMYLSDIPIDLSKLFIILSLNDASVIDNVLLDRITLVNVDNYTITDKINIARDYIFPKTVKNIGISKDDIIITNDGLQYLVNIVSPRMSDGIRPIEKAIEQMLYRLNMEKLMNLNKLKFPYELSRDNIEKIHIKYSNDLPFNMYI